MFKLKLINKPKMIKLKCGFSFPNIVLANLQEKEIIPTKNIQNIVADFPFDGLSKVTVNPIPDEYIIPSGEIEFTQNGTYDVTDKASAKVNVPEKQLGTKTITQNGTYNASDDNLDGYSQVEVQTSGVDINDYFDLTKKNDGVARTYIKKFPLVDTSSYTSLSYFFDNFFNLEEIPLLNTSKVTNMNRFCNYCKKLKKFPQLDTSKVTVMSEMFSNNYSLQEIPLLDCSKVVQAVNMLWYVNPGVKLGGFLNFGQAFLTSASANYMYYTLDLSQGRNIYFATATNLSHESLMNVINNLYDIATKGVATQQLILGSKNLEKLTAEELAIATTKGFSVS